MKTRLTNAYNLNITNVKCFTMFRGSPLKKNKNKNKNKFKRKGSKKLIEL